MKLFIHSIWLLCLVSCTTTTVPVTGRKQLILVSPSEIESLSAKQYRTFIADNPLSKDTAQTATIRRVGERIQAAAEKYMRANGLGMQLRYQSWQFNLVEDKAVNAWCMPGGRVVFYTGILPVCQDETGIAVVMGHEIAHALANHAAERMSQAMQARIAGSIFATLLSAIIVGATTKEDDSQEKITRRFEFTNILFNQAVGIITSLGLLKFSRDQEAEADKIGLTFMAMAGYNPDEAPKFWKRMQSSEGKSSPVFLSTHPSSQTRIANLMRQLPQVREIYRLEKSKY